MPRSLKELFEEQSLQVLYRKMDKTAKARFNCAKRLQLYHIFTLWTMSGFSAGLIVLSSLAVYKIPIFVSPETCSFFQFCLSLVILVISLLLSSGNYSDRSEKMHRCGLEINSLCHKILPSCKANNDSDLYEDTLTKYLNILSAYENHAQVDFDLVKIDYKDEYNPTTKFKNLLYLRYALRFWVHILLLITLIYVFVYVLTK